MSLRKAIDQNAKIAPTTQLPPALGVSKSSSVARKHAHYGP